MRLRMIRNRLAYRSLDAAGYTFARETFVGNLGACWGDAEDTIHAAKVLLGSPERKAGKVALKGGLFEGNLLDATGAKALADMPGPEERKAMMAGAVAAPVRNVVGLVQAPVSALVRVLQARADSLGEGGDS